MPAQLMPVLLDGDESGKALIAAAFRFPRSPRLAGSRSLSRAARYSEKASMKINGRFAITTMGSDRPLISCLRSGKK